MLTIQGIIITNLFQCNNHTKTRREDNRGPESLGPYRKKKKRKKRKWLSIENWQFTELMINGQHNLFRMHVFKITGKKLSSFFLTSSFYSTGFNTSVHLVPFPWVITARVSNFCTHV